LIYNKTLFFIKKEYIISVYFLIYKNMSKKDKKNSSCKPLAKRFIISITLALLFGLLCSYLAWNGDPTLKSST